MWKFTELESSIIEQREENVKLSKIYTIANEKHIMEMWKQRVEEKRGGLR